MLDIYTKLQDKFRRKELPAHVVNFFQVELINLLLAHKHRRREASDRFCEAYLTSLDHILNQ